METTRSNLEAFSVDDSLHFAGLPKTGLDAITVCEKLNMPYLWVDRLYIVQDDDIRRQYSLKGFFSRTGNWLSNVPAL